MYQDNASYKLAKYTAMNIALVIACLFHIDLMEKNVDLIVIVFAVLCFVVTWMLSNLIFITAVVNKEFNKPAIEKEKKERLFKYMRKFFGYSYAFNILLFGIAASLFFFFINPLIVSYNSGAYFEKGYLVINDPLAMKTLFLFLIMITTGAAASVLKKEAKVFINYA